MKWKKSSLNIPASTALDEHTAIPMLQIGTIASNITGMFATIFNLMPDGISTFASVSPSLEEISFSVNKAGKEISWGDDFEEFMDSLLCRLALTGKAILTLTTFPDAELKVRQKESDLSMTIQGWTLAGDAAKPVAFVNSDIKRWYGKYGHPRPNCRIKFVTGYSL